MDLRFRNQVALLLRILPEIDREKDFALHGGTAINLFYHDMPRLSVDIDLTYIPFGLNYQEIFAHNSYSGLNYPGRYFYKNSGLEISSLRKFV